VARFSFEPIHRPLRIPAFFIFIITPLGWVLRLSGKDLLQLKRPREANTFWHSSKDGSPMDRLF
jgi:hypothetical protein